MSSRAAEGQPRGVRAHPHPVPACLAALAVLAAACSPDAQGDGATDARPVRGGSLVVAGPTDITSMNGLVSNETYAGELQRHALFTTLLRHDAELRYQPYLASDWTLEGDTLLTFELREDVRWHDGVPTTAQDVVFTFRRATDPATGFPNDAVFRGWHGAEPVDSFTVSFRIDPQPDPLAAWVQLPIMPRHLLDSIPPERLRTAAFNRAPVGNGPFRFVRQRPNERWVFEANDSFPEDLGGRPHLDRLVWRVIPDDGARLVELRTGAAHLALAAPPERVAALDSLPHLRVHARPSRAYLFVAWNGKRPPLDDARVRRALTMAIDRPELVQLMRAGFATLASAPVPPGHWAYADLPPLPYDTAAAARLLDEAGLRDRDGDGVREGPDGRDVEIELKVAAESPFNRDMGEAIRADLARVGVRVVTRPVDFATMVGDMVDPQRRFDAVFLRLETDPRLSLRELFHSEAMGGPFQLASYQHAEVDSLLDRLDRRQEREEARRAWHRLQEILREDQPWTFLWFAPDLLVFSERVENARPDIRGVFAGVSGWWLEPEAGEVSDPAG